MNFQKKLYLFYIAPSFTFVVNHRACALRKKVHVTIDPIDYVHGIGNPTFYYHVTIQIIENIRVLTTGG